MRGSEIPGPIFMFGYERSGTTLLSMMAGAHPELAVPLTVTGMWFRYAQKLGEYNNLASRADVDRLVRDLLDEERISLWDESIEAEEVLAQLRESSYPAVIAAFHRVYANKKNKPHWANMDIATLDEMHQMYNWFPDARFLHIVRDGRDVALSHETMPYGEANTLDCAQSWERRLTTNMKMGKMLPDLQYKIIRYEDLVLDSEKTLADLCRFFGLAYSPRMLEYTSMVSKKIPESRRWLWPELDKAPQKSKCYGWKIRMDTKKRVVFEAEAGSLLSQLSYETYEKVPRTPSAYAYELWCFLGRKGRLRRLRRALGMRKDSKLQKEWTRKHGD